MKKKLSLVTKTLSEPCFWPDSLRGASNGCLPNDVNPPPPRVADCLEAALRCKDINDSEANSQLWTNEDVLGACLDAIDIHTSRLRGKISFPPARSPC